MNKKFIILAIAIALSGCGSSTVSSSKSAITAANALDKTTVNNSARISGDVAKVSTVADAKPGSKSETVSFINPSGKTLKNRILTPEGYKRISAEKGSFASFLRNYKMKPDKSPVLLYDGSKKGNQSAHIAVFKLPIENEDLQQCADSIMRVYGEYYYKKKAYNNIKFSLGTGFVADFNTWRKGYAIVINGNKISWTPSSKNNSGYSSFKRFMRIVFAYSGTLDMDKASKKIPLSKAKIGDIFIRGGSPGHVVLIADICKNAKGKKAYLLAQGYMPAQEFQVLRNSLHNDDPWYYENEITYPLDTPEYTFDKGSLRKYK